MRRSCLRSIFLALALFCASLTAAFAKELIGLPNVPRSTGISMEAWMPYQKIPGSGFAPLHFRIENRTNSSHTWEVGFSSSFGGTRQTGMDWSTELTVAPGQIGEWDLFLPRAGLDSDRSGYQMLQGRISGYGVESERFVIPSNYFSGTRTSYVLISDTLAKAAWSKLEAEARTISPPPLVASSAAASTSPPVLAASNVLTRRFVSSSRSGRALEGSRVKPREIPADWRALAGVAGFWLTDKDWLTLSADQRRTIRQWVGAGGHLFVASTKESITTLPMLPSVLEAGKRLPIGLGIVEAVQLESNELPVDDTVKKILALDYAAFPAWHSDYRDWSLFKAIGHPHMNVPLIIVFVCVFAVVIGPINLRLFAPPSRRYRLFFTVPMLSIAASILLFGVIAFGDGFGGSGYRNALIYLPAGENIATISQEQISRSRLLFGRTFSVPEEAQLSLVQLSSDNNAKFSLQRSGKSVTGDWFRSRALQVHAIRATVPSRAEVVLQNPTAAADQRPVLLSSVSGFLRDVVYFDFTGRPWRTAQLGTGAPVTLEPCSPEQLLEWTARVTTDLSPHLKTALESVQGRAGNFYAVAESMPEAPLATLPGIRWQQQTLVCFGPCVKGESK